jgi:histidyl-tRNA synthetase
MSILNDLWSVGIKAETVYQENPKVARQLEFALESGIPLILWLGEDEVKQGVIKIKSLNKHEEYIMKRDELVDKIRDIIANGNDVLLPQAQQQMKQGGGKKEEEKKE